MRLIELIKLIQKRDKLTDTTVAKRIGITRVRWNQIKNGAHPNICQDTISGILKGFPEIKADIFLSSDLP